MVLVVVGMLKVKHYQTVKNRNTHKIDDNDSKVTKNDATTQNITAPKAMQLSFTHDSMMSVL